MKDDPEVDTTVLRVAHEHTTPFVRTAALYASTNQIANLTTSSAPVEPRQAVERCERCGGRVVGRFESDYSCINCGRYPLDCGAEPTAHPARMVGA